MAERKEKLDGKNRGGRKALSGSIRLSSWAGGRRGTKEGWHPWVSLGASGTGL